MPARAPAGALNRQLDGLLYNLSWRTARDSSGTGCSGVLWHRASSVSAENIFTQKYTPAGRNSVTPVAIAGVTDLITKAKGEVDPVKHTAIIQDIQKKLAVEFPDVSWAGDVPGFTLRWPWLKNHGVFLEGLGGTARSYVQYWYDAKVEKETA